MKRTKKRKLARGRKKSIISISKKPESEEPSSKTPSCVVGKRTKAIEKAEPGVH